MGSAGKRKAERATRLWPKWATARAANASLPLPRRRLLPFAFCGGLVCTGVCVWLRPSTPAHPESATQTRTRTHILAHAPID
jgi:hypothetical protein